MNDSDTDCYIHLEFYRVCANTAIITTITLEVLVFALFIGGYDRYPILWFVIYAVPVTITLFIGRYSYPRLCSFLILLKHHIVNLYSVSFLGENIPSLFVVYFFCATFFFVGYIESIQVYRINSDYKLLWLAKAGLYQYITILIINVILMFTIWVIGNLYYFPFLHL